MSKTLFDVFEGIVSSDFEKEVMADPSGVQNYAESMDMNLSLADAEEIIKVHTFYKDKMVNGDGEWGLYFDQAKNALDAYEDAKGVLKCLEVTGGEVAPSEVSITVTERGFGRMDFEDSNGVSCSLQESSSAMEPKIWLGCNDANPRYLVKGSGWIDVSMPEGYIADTRMHLNREQVRILLPYLLAFVGEKV